jgi:sec-independent protein translocase protein TatB
MFDIGWSELLLIGMVALIAIGPKELPGVLRTVGQWTGKVRRMAADFQGQFNEAMREAEIANLKEEIDTAISDTTDSLKAKLDPLSKFDPLAPNPPSSSSSTEATAASIAGAMAAPEGTTATAPTAPTSIEASTETPAAATAAPAEVDLQLPLFEPPPPLTEKDFISAPPPAAAAAHVPPPLSDADFAAAPAAPEPEKGAA